MAYQETRQKLDRDEDNGGLQKESHTIPHATKKAVMISVEELFLPSVGGCFVWKENSR